VARALLPLLYWRGVAVVREKRQELTVLERFVLEMGLTLGTAEPEDFAEITSLPASALAGATWRLIPSGTFSPRGGSYGVDPEQAAAALEQKAIRRLVRASADFVLLPRSDDLLAVTGRDGGWLRDLAQRLVADQQAPLPRPLWTATRAAYLAQKVRAGAVPGLDPDVVDVPVPDQGDSLLVPQAERHDSPGLPFCPVYLCRAEIRRTDTGVHVVDAVAYGRPRRSGRKDQDGTAEVEIDLTGARGLIAGWLELPNALDDPQMLQAVWREVGPPDTGYGRPPLDGAHRRGAAEWDLLVNGTAATELCEQDRPLTQPRGLALETAEVTIHIVCHFFPTDDQARALFARDEVVAHLLTAQQPAKEFPVACQEASVRCPGADGALSEESVRERIWQLGHHHLVYLLRERKDFAYD
jgi:hypothetical protein